ncbi:MAG: phage shock protein E [Paraglaciecola sp.]|jgi:phage shock protein E
MQMKLLILSIYSLFSLSANAAKVTDIDSSQLLESNTSDWLILDVRSPEEFLLGHVPQAINIPHDKIEQNMHTLIAYKDKTVVLYCKSGYRANKAGKVLSQLGFSELRHLDGDMSGWQKSGLPIQK